jgi:hypothetical protein
MTLDGLKALAEATPFRPFRFSTNLGIDFEVGRREAILFPAMRPDWVIVFSDSPEGASNCGSAARMHVIDVETVREYSLR